MSSAHLKRLLPKILSLSLIFFNPTTTTNAETVETEYYKAVFDDGWLISWKSKETGESFVFGRDGEVDDTEAQRHYKPGVWSVRSTKGQKAEVNFRATKKDDKALIIEADASSSKPIESLQWGLKLPFDQFDAVHWPRGLAPARITGKGALQSMWIRKFYPLQGREGVLSTHDWRMRYYLIQGKKGGLLIYVDDPEQRQANILEYKTNNENEVTISNRAYPFPPSKKEMKTAPWVIRQYAGPITEGALLYQKYLEQAYDPTPLDKRKTAWVTDLAWTFVGAPWTRPLPFEGKGRPVYNYTSGWEESMKVDEQWLDNCAKVLEPEKTLFYISDWRVPTHDTYFGDYTVDPYFARMVGKVKKRGFKVMIHIHNHLIMEPTAFYHRLVKKQSEWLGHDPEKEDAPWGVGYDHLRQTPIIQKEKAFGNTWATRQGIDRVQTGYHMNPAYEGQRYFKSSEILSIVRATGADAVHIDVPSHWIERHNERYGMNSTQGMGEMYRMIREVLDENGFEHVAIATELSPGESYFKYVDLAQNVRTNSVRSLLRGEMAAEELIELQTGKELEGTLKDRQKKSKSKKRFDLEFYESALGKMRELREPALDALVLSPYVKGYPHLGAAWPNAGGYQGDPNQKKHNTAVHALDMWYSLIKDTLPHSGGGCYNMFMDTEPWDDLDIIQYYRKKFAKEGVRKRGKIFNDFDYGKFALARFFEAKKPQFAPLGEWKQGDLARYKLNDGQSLIVRTTGPLSLSLTLSDGGKLADLHIFEGWKDAAMLLDKYGPKFLKNQLD